MTVTTQVYGYSEAPYLNGPYLTSNATASGGLQMEFKIQSEKSSGVQFEAFIVDYLNQAGLQGNFVIQDIKPFALQSEFVTELDKPTGLQFESQVSAFKNPNGIQFEGKIASSQAKGFEFRADKYPSKQCPEAGYLGLPYLEDPYLGETWCMSLGLQANFVVRERDFNGIQAELTIKDYLNNQGIQTEFRIVDFKKFLGMQFDAQRISAVALQFLAAIYNTHNLRVLCDFSSRGLIFSNWTANTTEAGDFPATNLNTDIVEQYWRSAQGVTTGIVLDCDTGVPQGSIIDTLAILDHNLTTSATVTLLGSNTVTHSPVGTTIVLEPRLNNMYYIAETLPSTGFRYWRFTIDDATNPDSFLKIGTIVFGTSQIFHEECFVDNIDFTLKDFAATVETEGFTNVANSRTIKRSIRLDFRLLEANRRNYKILRSIFENIRTTLKCLWIPTPDPDDQEITAKFAAFGKLPALPTERHNNRGKNQDYVDFTIEVDESK